MSEEIRGPREVEGDIVLVHHLIRRLGRRPTAAEILQAQREWQSMHDSPKDAPPVPDPRGSDK